MLETSANYGMQDRLVEFQAPLLAPQRGPRQVAGINNESEVAQLIVLADRIKNLVQDHTAAPKVRAMCGRANRSRGALAMKSSRSTFRRSTSLLLDICGRLASREQPVKHCRHLCQTRSQYTLERLPCPAAT